MEKRTLICRRCGHTWVARQEQSPKSCPNKKCHSRYWNRPRLKARPKPAPKSHVRLIVDVETDIPPELLTNIRSWQTFMRKKDWAEYSTRIKGITLEPDNREEEEQHDL